MGASRSTSRASSTARARSCRSCSSRTPARSSTPRASSAWSGFPTQSAYCASKFAVRGFTESLRHELRGTGVRAITIHPGGVKTNIVAQRTLPQRPAAEGRTTTQIADEFEALARTSPERAAEIIHKGVDAGKARILVGPDAYVFDYLTRLAPTHYYAVLSRLEGVLSRRTRRRLEREAGSL